MKKIITLLLALIIVLGTLASCSVMDKVKLPGAKADEEPEHEHDIAIDTAELIAETEEPEVEPIVLSDFLGDWHPASESGKVELRIFSADSYFVEFSLWFANKGEINNVNAIVDGNTASFDMGASDNTISGELVFEESRIKLNIEKSKVGYISAGTLVFDGKHSSSYQEKANAEKEKENQIPVANGIVAPTYTVSPFDKYVNTPNNILYLRKGPAKSYEGIEKMPHNSLVEVCGFNSDRSWVYVYYYSKGVYGWCSDEYLVY